MKVYKTCIEEMENVWEAYVKFVTEVSKVVKKPINKLYKELKKVGVIE